MMKNLIFLILLVSISRMLTAQNDFHAKSKNLPCVERTFYAYIHIVLDSTGKTNITSEKISEILSQASKAFAPICISFDYCKLDTVRDYSFNDIKDEVEVNLLISRFQKKRRLNIYFVENVISNDLNSFSYFNGITQEDVGIIVVPKSGIGLIHELGHSFGLYHTFEKQFGIELVDQSNCETTGDLICDTPADPYYYLYEQCEFTYTGTDTNGDFYRTEIGNYMSHIFCAHCFFTHKQYEVMAENYLSSTFKMW